MLNDFWEEKIPGVSSSGELLSQGTILQFGVAPNRIDLINKIDAVSFKEAWDSRIEEEIEIEGERYQVHYIGLEELIRNKEAVRRYKDLKAALKRKG